MQRKKNAPGQRANESRSKMSFLNEVHGGAVQPKLTVGPVNDKFEVEADQMADKVMRMPAPELKMQRTVSNLDLSNKSAGESLTIQKKATKAGAIQKKCSDCDTEEKSEEQIIQKKEADLTLSGDVPIQPKVISNNDNSDNLRRHVHTDFTAGIQRKGEGKSIPISQKITRLTGGNNIRRKEDELLQKKGSENLGRGPPMGDFSSKLHNSKQGGSSMDNGTESFMSSRFGADFSGVKIHTGSQAAHMSNSINAKAFTHQNHVYFNKGQYQPNTHSGKTLLAHELTHTIQQGSVNTGVQTKLEVGASDDIFEKEADQMADRVMRSSMQYDEVMRMPQSLITNSHNLQRKCSSCEEAVQRKTWEKEEQYNPYSTKTTEVQRKPFTSNSANLQRQITQSSHSRGPPAEVIHRKSNIIQRGFWDDPLGSIGNAVSGAVEMVGDSLDAGVDWIKEQLRDMARAMPGYSLFSVVIGQDPITGTSVERNGRNFINAGLDLIPNGADYKRKLEEDGGMDEAATWLDEQMAILDINVVDVQRDFSAYISSLSLSDVASPTAALSRGINTFRPYIERLARFAETVAVRLLEIVKDIAINALLEFVRDQTPWYPLITVILGEDPITGDAVERNGMNILRGFILLHPEGDAQLAQMEESGSLQRAADWVDESIIRVAQIIEGIKNGFTTMWESFSITTLLDPVGAFTQIYSLFSTPVSELIAFAIEVALIILQFIKDALIARLIEYAQTIPGYHLVTVIMGKDVFSEEPVERSAINIIRGFMSLVPGGEEKFQEMQQTGAIEEALGWIEGAVTELDLTWPMVRGLFTTAWNEFSLADLATPIETFMRVLDLFGAPLFRLIRFVGRVVIKLVEIALRIMGFPFELIGSIISRAQAAFELIKNDPIGFLKNILRAVKQAFVQFFGNILTHLMTGVGGWLFGQLGDAGITMPPDFSFQSILGLVFEILGITRESIYEKLREKVGEERWAQIESTIETMTGVWSFISDVFTRGPIAIWEKVQEQLSNLWETVLSAARNWIMTRIITQITVRLLSMLDPTGIMAVVNSFMVFFSAVQSAIEYMIPMLEMLNSFLGGVVQIAEGNIQPAADFLEQTMARGMPILIGFMANQVGLGGIGARIREVIESIQVRVDAGIQWAIDRAWEIGSGLLTMGRNAVGAIRDAIRGWWGSRTTFTSRTNQHHELYFNGEGNRAVLIMASNDPDGLEEKIRERKAGDNITPAITTALDQALSIKGEMDAAIRAHTASQDSSAEETDTLRPVIDAFLDRIKQKLIDGDIDGAVDRPPSNVTYQMEGSKAKKVTVDPLTSMPGNTRGTPAEGSPASPEGWALSQRVNAGSVIRDENGVDLTTSTGQLRLSKPWKRVHLLSHLLHGPALNWNLVPATQQVNSSLLSAHETEQKNNARDGITQKFEITVNYYADDAPLEVRNREHVITAIGKKSDYPESFTVKKWVQNDAGEMVGGSPSNITGTELPQSDGTNFAHLITHYEGVIDRYFTGISDAVAQTTTFSIWYNSAMNSSIRVRITENNPAHWAGLSEYFYEKRTERRSTIPPNVSPKLKIGSPNDPLEMEADQMADRVMRMPQTAVQRKCSTCEDEEVQRKPLANRSNIESAIQRKCSGCEDEEVQRKPIASLIQRVANGSSSESASSSFTSSINANKGSGVPMDSSTQGFMADRFGADFSNVKIHTGSKANELSDQIQAKAFTTGNDIYFNKGEYQPGTSAGKHLLAHELTHTIQQSAAKSDNVQRKVPTGINVKAQKAGDFSNLSDANKRKYGSYIVGVTQMEVTPRDDYSGNCVKEYLTVMSNDCPKSFKEKRGDKKFCTGHWCLDIGNGGGDGKSGVFLPKDKSSFTDRHLTRAGESYLEGSNVDSCQVICHQKYAYNRKKDLGSFYVIRTFKAGQWTDPTTKAVKHYTGGTIVKVPAADVEAPSKKDFDEKIKPGLATTPVPGQILPTETPAPAKKPAPVETPTPAPKKVQPKRKNAGLASKIQRSTADRRLIQRKNFNAHFATDLNKGFHGDMEIDMVEKKSGASGKWDVGMSGWVSFKPTPLIDKRVPDSPKIGLTQIVKVTDLETSSVSSVNAKYPTISPDVETKASGTGKNAIEEGYFVDKNFTNILSGKEPHSKFYIDQGKTAMAAGKISRTSQRTNKTVTFSDKHGSKKGAVTDNAVLTDSPEWSKSSEYEFETYAQSATHNYGGVKWGFVIDAINPLFNKPANLSTFSTLTGMDKYVTVTPSKTQQLFSETPTAVDAIDRFKKHGKTAKSVVPATPKTTPVVPPKPAPKPAPIAPTPAPVQKKVQPKRKDSGAPEASPVSQISIGTVNSYTVQRKAPWEIADRQRELDPAKVPSTFNYELVNHRLIAHNPKASDLDQIVEVIAILNLYFKVDTPKVKLKKMLESQMAADSKGKIDIDITPHLPEPVQKYLANLEAWYAAWRAYVAKVGTWEEWFAEVKKIPGLTPDQRAKKAAEYHKNSPKSSNEHASVCHNFVMLLIGGDTDGVVPGSSGPKYEHQITRDGQQITDFYSESLKGKGAYKEVKQDEVQVGDIIVFKASAAARRRDSTLPKTGIVHSALVIRVAGKTIEVIEKENPRSPASTRTVASILNEYRKDGVSAKFLSPGLAGMPKGDEKKTGLTEPTEAYTIATGVAEEDTFVLFTIGVDYSRAHEDKKLMQLIAENQTEAVEFKVHGYASIDGDERQNLNLSGHRAIAVKKALLTHFPKGSKATAFAHGETEHFGGLKANRRAGVKLFKGNKDGKSPSKDDKEEVKPDYRLLSIDEFKNQQIPPPLQFNTLLELPPVPDFAYFAPSFSGKNLLMSDRETEQILSNWNYAYEFFGEKLSIKPDYAEWLANFSMSIAYDKQLSIEFPTQQDELINDGFMPALPLIFSYDLFNFLPEEKAKPKRQKEIVDPINKTPKTEQRELKPEGAIDNGSLEKTKGVKSAKSKGTKSAQKTVPKDKKGGKQTWTADFTAVAEGDTLSPEIATNKIRGPTAIALPEKKENIAGQLDKIVSGKSGNKDDPAAGGGKMATPEVVLPSANSKVFVDSLSSQKPTHYIAGLKQSGGALKALQQNERDDLKKSFPEIEQPTGVPTKQMHSKAKIQEEAKNKTDQIGAIPNELGDLTPVGKKEGDTIKVDSPQPPSTFLERMRSFFGFGKSGSDEDRKYEIKNGIKKLPTTENVDTDPGTRPKVDLSGQADPKKNANNQKESEDTVEKARIKNLAESKIYKGENDIFPEIETELLTPKTELTDINAPASLEDELPGITEDFQMKFDTNAQNHLDAKLAPEIAKHDEKFEKKEADQLKARDDTDEKIANETQRVKDEQITAQNEAKTEVQSQRTTWQKENESTKKEFSTKSAAAKLKVDGEIEAKTKDADTKVEAEFTKAKEKGDKEVEKTNKEAEAKKAKAKKESENKSWWDRAIDAIGDFFDMLKSALNKLFDGLKALVKGFIELAKKAVNALIDLARDAIIGLIKGFGEILKGIVSVALFAFPKLRDKINAAIDDAVNKAVEKVEQWAEDLKKAVNDFLDALGAALDAILSAFQGFFNFLIDAMKFIAVGLIKILRFLANIEEHYRTFKKGIDGLIEIWDNPKILEDYVQEFLGPYIDKIPGEAGAQFQKYFAEGGVALVTHLKGIWSHLQPILDHMAANWWEEIKKMAWFLIWPFAEGSPLYTDAPKLWNLIPEIWDNVWAGEFSKAMDGGLEWLQAFNMVLGAFSGWILIGSVLVGAIIGAFFGGAGAIPGAAAGLEVGVAIGEGILISMVAGEAGMILKAIYDLATTEDDGIVGEKIKAKQDKESEGTQSASTTPTTGEPEKQMPVRIESGDIETGNDRIQYAYQRIANSGFMLAVIAVFMILGAIGGKIGQGLAKFAKGSKKIQMALLAIEESGLVQNIKNSKAGQAFGKTKQKISDLGHTDYRPQSIKNRKALKKSAAAAKEDGIVINTSASLGDGTRMPYSSLTKRQKGILKQLKNPGDHALIRKKSVSMNDLKHITNVTGDEFNMFTLKGQRLIIRGKGNKIVVSEQMYQDLIAGKYGKFSGHTHPPGASTTPGPADRPFLTDMKQERSGIWGNTSDEPTVYGRTGADDARINSDIRTEKMRRYYEGQNERVINTSPEYNNPEVLPRGNIGGRKTRSGKTQKEGTWKKRRVQREGDSGLKDHAGRHSELSAPEYLAKGQKNMTDGVLQKGGGKYPDAKYYVRKLADDNYSITITNKHGQIVSIDTWVKNSQLTKEMVMKGLEKSGVLPKEKFWIKVEKKYQRSKRVAQGERVIATAPETGAYFDQMNLGDAVVTKKHHNWNKIFGDNEITLAEIRPYVDKALAAGTWKVTGVLRGKGGVIVGDKLELVQNIGGHNIWVGGIKTTNGKIIVNNAAVQ